MKAENYFKSFSMVKKKERLSSAMDYTVDSKVSKKEKSNVGFQPCG